MVGCNYLYAFAANLRSRESRRRRHVARVFRDPGELGWIRTVSTPNAQRPTPNTEPRSGGLQTAVGDLEIALPCFLSFARARLSCQRPDRVDTAASRRWLNHLHAKLADVTALQVCGWCFADACSGRALGNPGADSNTWGVFHSGNWTTRRQPFVYDTGRSRREFLRHVRAAIAILFCHRLHQFLSVVDQVAVVDSRNCGGTREAGVDAPGYSGSPLDIYLLSGIAVVFVIFTLVSTKLPHYTLPAFPLLALLLARHWHQGAAVESRRSLFRTIAVATACVWIAVALVVPQIVARFFPAYQLFEVSRGSLQPNMQFAAVEFHEPSLVWYFRSRVQGFLTPLNKRRAAEFMSAPDPRFIVLPTPVAGELFANPPESWRFFTINGFNIAKGKRVDLTLVLKRE